MLVNTPLLDRSPSPLLPRGETSPRLPPYTLLSCSLHRPVGVTPAALSPFRALRYSPKVSYPTIFLWSLSFAGENGSSRPPPPPSPLDGSYTLRQCPFSPHLIYSQRLFFPCAGQAFRGGSSPRGWLFLLFAFEESSSALYHV